MTSLELTKKLMLFSKIEVKAIQFLHFVTIDIAYVLLLRYESKLHSWKLVFFFKCSCGKITICLTWSLSFILFPGFFHFFHGKGHYKSDPKTKQILASRILTAGSSAEITDGWLSERSWRKHFYSAQRRCFSEKPGISVFYLNL